jgi:hypothetical protein
MVSRHAQGCGVPGIEVDGVVMAGKRHWQTIGDRKIGEVSFENDKGLCRNDKGLFFENDKGLFETG